MNFTLPAQDGPCHNGGVAIGHRRLVSRRTGHSSVTRRALGSRDATSLGRNGPGTGDLGLWRKEAIACCARIVDSRSAIYHRSGDTYDRTTDVARASLPSPAVSEPPAAMAWRKLEPGDGPAPARTTHGRSTRQREPVTRSVAATARGCTTTSGRSISRPTPGGSSTRAAGARRRASGTRPSGWTASASSCGPASRARRPSSTTSGRTTP